MSKIEVNTIEPQCGTTLTLGANNDTVVLGTGAAFSGGIGAVKWETTPQTGSFGGVSGRGYFINSGSPLTLTLPTGTAGAIIAVSDYARNFATHNFTITPAGSQKIGGTAASTKLDVDSQAATFVYVDDTKGWINVQNSENTEVGSAFITATGGTIATVCTDFKVHTFTGPGTFCVSQISNVSANNQVSYVVVAGGGGGGENRGGGGGAGGYREDKSPVTPYTASPLEGAGAISVTATAFPITVGAGGTGTSCGNTQSTSGANSIFSTITSAGGGFGGSKNAPQTTGSNGGSGGGGMGADGTGSSGGLGNQPPVTPAQGRHGGTGDGSSNGSGAGGGGAGAEGVNGSFPNGGNGGAGVTSSINGTPTARAGGGGGGGWTGGGGTGGTGGGGNGVRTTPTDDATNGTDNTGGGGGSGPASGPAGKSGNGGSGVVIIRYKFQ